MKLLLFFSSKILIILQKFPNIKKVVIGDGRKTKVVDFHCTSLEIIFITKNLVIKKRNGGKHTLKLETMIV